MISFPAPFGKSGVIYVVRSQSAPDQFYEVVVGLDGRATDCQCKGWTYRKKCRHAKIAEAAIVLDMERYMILLKESGLYDLSDAIARFAKAAQPSSA